MGKTQRDTIRTGITQTFNFSGLTEGDDLAIQIIENWSDIVARIKEINPSKLTGYHEVMMLVEQVKAVKGYANLLDKSVGKEIKVNFPEEHMKSIEINVDTVISCRVRKANLTTNFVHPQRIFFSVIRK